MAWLFCDRGAALDTAGKTQLPPNPKGQQPASRRTGHSCSDLPDTHAERGPRPLVISPFGFCGSRRQWVVNPRTRVSGALAVEDNRPSRRLALLEPETTKRATGPRVYKSSSTWSHRGQPALVTATGLSAPRPHKGNRPSCLQKQLQNWTTRGQPVPQESRSPRLDSEK